MSAPFIKQLYARRTIYALSKNDFPISDETVVKVVQDVIAATPSSFNNQTNRAIVLFGASHDKLWSDFAYNGLKGILPEEQFASTAEKLKGFAAAYGTVLFFEDTHIIREFEEKFAIFAPNFVPWAEQSAGAAQINTWTALEAENVGANLQHYNEIVREKVEAEFDVPSSWKLSAQLVFGTKVGEPYEKQTLPGSKTVKTA